MYQHNPNSPQLSHCNYITSIHIYPSPLYIYILTQHPKDTPIVHCILCYHVPVRLILKQGISVRKCPTNHINKSHILAANIVHIPMGHAHTYAPIVSGLINSQISLSQSYVLRYKSNIPPKVTQDKTVSTQPPAIASS